MLRSGEHPERGLLSVEVWSAKCGLLNKEESGSDYAAFDNQPSITDYQLLIAILRKILPEDG